MGLGRRVGVRERWLAAPAPVPRLTRLGVWAIHWSSHRPDVFASQHRQRSSTKAAGPELLTAIRPNGDASVNGGSLPAPGCRRHRAKSTTRRPPRPPRSSISWTSSSACRTPLGSPERRPAPTAPQTRRRSRSRPAARGQTVAQPSRPGARVTTTTASATIPPSLTSPRLSR